MSDESNSSRVENLLGNMVGQSHDLEKPRSRIEDTLYKILHHSSDFIKPGSKVESLLIELADIIESGSSPDVLLTDLYADTNGTYYPPADHQGFSEVEVDVSPSLQSLYANSNATYFPDIGSDGFSEVTVDVSPSLQSLYANSNATYFPDAGYDGFSEVTVDVPGLNSAMSISGTLADPFSDSGIPFSDAAAWLQVLWSSIRVRPAMIIDGTSLGLGDGMIFLRPDTDSNTNGDIIVGFGGQVDQAHSMAASATWGENGLVNAYVEQDGIITDLTSYANMIPVVVFVPVDDPNV